MRSPENIASPVTFGILSTARIARGFVAGVRDSASVRVTHVASRSIDSARVFATDFEVPHAVGSYEALLAEPGVEAVYLPLPNHLHAEWAIRAFEAGKHVLCEKPLALNEAQARRMFEAAARHGRVLLEAYPYLFQPQTHALHGLVQGGELGELQALQASFGFTLDRPGDYRFDPAMGGGALLDVGCYPISLARLLFGSRPLRVQADAYWAASAVDMRLAATLHFEGGRTAQIHCGMDSAIHRQATVIGSRAVAFSDYLNHTRAELPGHLRLRRGVDWDGGLEEVPYALGSGFRFEAEAFAAQVQGTGTDAAMRSLSLDVAATLEAVLASARQGRAVDVPAAA
jgi:predicted dehydrogenase